MKQGGPMEWPAAGTWGFLPEPPFASATLGILAMLACVMLIDPPTAIS
jgi:hypothetical protein